ncbi:MAG: hypothetical protein O4861_17810 [Trichodesmium sp. St16_bin4-tuft]|nr:hypothetical protein [Trichodesmium sp. MAG_R01]MDE5074324.1 hypothetical protein [Trichodesmium sp. St5_bin8]MDE5100085.1 hypothetical protein [Trichodesmium sp. St16_bin4-tuft]MDE5101489.1 hypothetical protein [Trichodesmium sp. St19_bin2]
MSWDKAITKPDGSVTICYKLMPKQRKAIKYDQDNGVLIVAVTGNDDDVMSVMG